MEENYFLRWIGFGILALIVWLFFPFLKSFFVALLMTMAIFPLYRLLKSRIYRFKKIKTMAPLLSAGIVTLAFSLIVFMPITAFLFHFLSHPLDTIAAIRSFGDKIVTLSQNLPLYLEWLRTPLDTVISISKTHKDEIATFLAGLLGNGLKIFLLMLGNMTMIVVFFFFLTLYGRKLTLFFIPIIPLERSLKQEFLGEMTMMVSVVFYTFAGVMIAQGLAFGIFITFFDGYDPLVLGFLTGFTAIVPVVGTALVWVPVAANEYLHGNIFNALIIAVYSLTMMAFFIDNIVKLVILNFVNRTLSYGRHRINEFIIFFAIVGGLATFGFWGFILGPAIIALAVTTLRTLRKANRLTLGQGEAVLK
ncbi:AI-2E family transporter [bacterium]|jgi:predicted PurR-regulated permease PerM|nr:AI-2E family transporter [bacterium]